jgi:plasmid stabilization system protein ParE
MTRGAGERASDTNDPGVLGCLASRGSRRIRWRDHPPVNQIVLRPSADRDLVAIFRHYLREAGLRVADRFFLAAEATFARVAGMPGMGTHNESDESLYANLRYFPISRFR